MSDPILSNEAITAHEVEFGRVVAAITKGTADTESATLVVQAEVALNLRALVGYLHDLRDELQGIRKVAQSAAGGEE